MIFKKIVTLILMFMSVMVALNQRSAAERKGKGKAKRKSVDNSRADNAFALTAHAGYCIFANK